MKYLHWVVIGVVASSCSGIAATVATEKLTENSSEAWVAEFQRYAEQDKLGNESAYRRRQGDGTSIELVDILRQLPAPERWTELRQAFGAADTKISVEEKLRKLRLQAGGWLLAYMVGDRAALEAELQAEASATAGDEHSPTLYALKNLQSSLSGQEEVGMSPEKQIEAFEQQLAMLEPVDETSVKEILGDENNLARLKRFFAMVGEFQAAYWTINEEYEKDKDEAAARTKAEALLKDFQEKTSAERQALAPYLENPLVMRYMSSLEENEPDESAKQYVPSLYLPDLVALVGKERAEVLLRRALRLKADIHLNDKLSLPTQNLVRTLALAEIDSLKNPSWGLVQNENATALFEAFRKKFPTIDRKDYGFRQAIGYYVLGLIQLGRSDEAVKVITELESDGGEEGKIYLPYDVLARLERTHTDKLWEFCRARLAANPAVDDWSLFTRLSVQLNRRAELMGMIKALAQNENLQGLERLRVQQLQANAELATDEQAAAVGRLRVLINTPGETEPERALQMDMVERLLQLADLQGDDAGFAMALAAAESLLEKGRNDKAEQRIRAGGRLASVLNDIGRSADSARIGRSTLGQVADLEKAAGAVEVPKTPGEHTSEVPNELQSILNNLAGYSLNEILAQQLCAEAELGHWPEAAALLQENSWWGAMDVAGLLHRTLSCKGRPVGYYAARVAQTQGDLALTRRILEAQLVTTPAVDAVYEFYLKLVGQDAMPLLEKLAAADRYEERPLIWKARLQLEAKQVDAAIATLQQAITIDPSDGEQGRGDRMRVYAFMSEAMAAKGDGEKSVFFANVVKAIRLSETADRWLDAGALTHAIELYRKSLGFFQDAYCIQSRLAVRLAGEGKMDEAVEHYRHAFELMPDSFGRVESHCFGCEHVFAGEKSQSVAEEVFAMMLKARPEKAQLHYLSGYLREEQKRNAEAADFYREAVKLDPLYLNAWNRLAGLEDKLKYTPAQRDDLLLTLVKLDPAQRHVSPGLEKVSDLPRLWQVLSDTGRVLEQLPKVGVLWELKASAARLAEKKEGDSSGWHQNQERKDFAVILRSHPFVEALQAYLVSLKKSGQKE